MAKIIPPELSYDEAMSASSIMSKFEAEFGEHDTRQVLTAGAHNVERLRLTDYFVDCLTVAVSYECFSTFKIDHEFSRPTEEYIDWIRENVSFEEYQNIKESPVDVYKKKFESLDLI